MRSDSIVSSDAIDFIGRVFRNGAGTWGRRKILDFLPRQASAMKSIFFFYHIKIGAKFHNGRVHHYYMCHHNLITFFHCFFYLIKSILKSI